MLKSQKDPENSNNSRKPKVTHQDAIHNITRTISDPTPQAGHQDLIHQHPDHQHQSPLDDVLSLHRNKTQEQEVLNDAQDLKRKLHRIIYKSRDKTIKGAGAYPCPKLLFFHEVSHQGTGQYHTHLIHRSTTAFYQYSSSSGAPLLQDLTQQGQSTLQVEIH